VRIAGLVSIAPAVPAGAGLTIDFRAVEELGQPLVVLQLPGGEAHETRDAVAPASGGGRASGDSDAWFAELTPREREVAALLAAGLGNREIAARLCVTLGTAKDHVHHILEKTGLPNRAAVAAWTARR
jgi:DNA-binding NarL/FixJ family response regulator